MPKFSSEGNEMSNSETDPEGDEPESDETAQGKSLAPSYRADRLTRHGTPPAYLVASRFQGHIPPPDLLRDYETVLPGVANRLVVQMEANGSHRRYMDKATLFLRQGRSYLGLGAGLFVVLKFLDVSYRLVTAGHEVAGTVLGTVDLVALAAVFVGMGQTYKTNKTSEKATMPSSKKPDAEKENLEKENLENKDQVSESETSAAGK